MCKHKNITIKRYSSYTIPQGYTKLMEQDDIDMADYLDTNVWDMDKVYCDDCGKRIE